MVLSVEAARAHEGHDDSTRRRRASLEGPGRERHDKREGGLGLMDILSKREEKESVEETRGWFGRGIRGWIYAKGMCGVCVCVIFRFPLRQRVDQPTVRAYS